MDLYLSLIIIIPIIGAILLTIVEQLKNIFKNSNVHNIVIHSIANVTAAIAFIFSLLTVIIGELWKYNTVSLLEYGLLESLLITLFAFIVLMVVLFSVEFMKNKKAISYYYALIFTLFAGLTGVIMATNYFTLFISWEFMALSAIALIGYEREKRGAVEASLKAFIMGSVGAFLILLATALTFGIYGTVNFQELHTIIVEKTSASGTGINTNILGVIIGLYIIGFGFSACMIFLNTWVSDATSNALSTVSVLLSGIVAKAGVYGIYRTLYWAFAGKDGSILTDTSLVLAWIAILTILEGNYLVFVQFKRNDIVDLKRIFAYLSIVQIGFILLGLGAGTKDGLEASLFAILSHTLSITVLFLTSGIILNATRTSDLRKITGIGRKTPLIGVAITTSCLSLAALPITGGFVSRTLIIIATLNGSHSANMNLALMIVAIICSVFALVGNGYVIKTILFGEPEEEKGTIKLSIIERSVLVILVILIIAMAIFYSGILNIIRQAIQNLYPYQ